MSRGKILAGLIALHAMLAIVVTGCKHKDEPNKILDGVPVNVGVEVIPAQIAQQWLLMKRDMLDIVVPAVNKFSLSDVSWPELGSPDGTFHYTFTRTNSRYGTATYRIQFRDISGTPIPAVETSSTTLRSVDITGSNTGSSFAFTEAFNMDVQTFGAPDSILLLAGTSNVSGSNYSLTFTLPLPGCKSTFQGLSGGSAIVTGSGNGQPCTMNLRFEPALDMNGSITWEGSSGSLRVNIDGTGFVVTNQARFFLR